MTGDLARDLASAEERLAALAAERGPVYLVTEKVTFIVVVLSILQGLIFAAWTRPPMLSANAIVGAALTAGVLFAIVPFVAARRARVERKARRAWLEERVAWLRRAIREEPEAR